MRRVMYLSLLAVVFATCSVMADIETGLVAHYDFEGVSGTVIPDVSGNGHDGVSMSGTTGSNPSDATSVDAPIVEGPDSLGNAIDCDNGNFVQIVNHPDLNVTGPYTLALWTSIDDNLHTSLPTMFCCADQSWRIAVKDTGLIGFDANPKAGPWGATGTTDIATPKRWVHVVGTFDESGVLTIYVDGEVDGTATRTSTSIAAWTEDPVTIGAQINEGELRRLFDGQIDEVRLYNRALSAEDVQELYEYTSTRGVAHTPDPSGDESVDSMQVQSVEWYNWEQDPIDGSFVDDANIVEITGFDVWWSVGEEPNYVDDAPYYVAAAQTFDPTDESLAAITYDTTYYWRVDSYVIWDSNQITGNWTDVVPSSTWQFTTLPSTPVFMIHPEDTLVYAGETAEFFVEVVDTGESNTFQWYDGDDVAVNDGDDGGDVSVSSTVTTSTLSIANAEAVDELKSYYCKATNSGGDTDSTSAGLQLKRLLAYWPFETGIQIDPGVSNAPDTLVGEVEGGADPNVYTLAGKVGNCAVFNGDAVLYIDQADAAYFDSMNAQCTVSGWVRTAGARWTPWISRYGEGSEGWQLRRHSTNSYPAFTLRGTTTGAGDDGYDADASVFDDEWHHIVGVYDGSVKKVFIDGLFSASLDVTGDIAATDASIMLAGRMLADGTIDVTLDCDLDEVRLYNYALTSAEIAQLYLDDTGQEYVCNLENTDFDLSLDIDGDCMIGMAEFAAFAETWLNCARFPTSACGE